MAYECQGMNHKVFQKTTPRPDVAFRLGGKVLLESKRYFGDVDQRGTARKAMESATSTVEVLM